MDTIINEEVLALTYNYDSFPLGLSLPLDRIKLIDPKKTDRIKEYVRSEKIKLVVFDGCLPIDILIEACKAVKRARREEKINVTICIINQDKLLIEGTVWEQNPENVQKYLIVA